MAQNRTMQLDADACYRAVKTRDSRFDGRFFTAVGSTGIYCRPVCPARTPRRENCTFYPSAAAAQEAGYRPCLRCRPEVSPGLPAWQGSSATTARALRLIAEGALDEGSVEQLAERLGIGERHLRRLFADHLSASPVEVAQAQRVLLAKKLLTETALPITQIAHASGFASIRRFNDAMRGIFARPPRELRRSLTPPPGGPLRLKLAYRPPFAWEALLDFFGARALPGVETTAGGVYHRRFAGGSVRVHHLQRESALSVELHLDDLAHLKTAIERLRHMFDLDAETAEIARHLRKDPLLRPAIAAHPGLRIPGAWDAFELGVRAILGQQVSVPAARTLAGRLVERWGAGGLFPDPAALAEADLRQAGVTGARARTISTFAAAIASGQVKLDSSRSLEDLVASLTSLPGIGDWTAHYIALRAFGEPDAFPADDLGLRRAAGSLSARQLETRAEAWRPWRGYAALYLWSLYGTRVR
jgi:AraC family transcriptional regulator, regulatory protein of adaptative response / DNA-3-methyladenine glycosylase II